ncbi:uncharacterized protein LOC130211638 [Pseudoliparis swirei]|uniref:uncharacterized protein LOC130211638 n=1 Tax=Pseudoliparis swirei TaxID=2059687 RepID=UPI0024BD837E|nr:uncharacterized protein LOC130211638 [Pseudoliparis swirei]
MLAVRAELQDTFATIERKERQSLLISKIKVLTRKLRRYQKVVKEMKEGAAGEWRRWRSGMSVWRRMSGWRPGQAGRSMNRGQPSRGWGEVRPCGIWSSLPVLGNGKNSFVGAYQSFHERSHRTNKQVEIALSKASRVRSFLFHLSVGKSDLASWLFLDMPGIQKYTAELMQEGKEVTTINYYLCNILQFLTYLQETPPKSCRLRRAQISAITRAVQKALQNLARPIVSHQLKVKAAKMKKTVSRASLRRCQEQARLVIPELLTDYNLRDDFYGYFSAFVISIFGHSPGVLTNMTVPEVEAAKQDPLLPTDTGYVITIDEHKTNTDFGGAQIFLTFEEFSWLERWLEIRKHLSPKNRRVFVTRGDGPVKNMVRYLQTAWAQMGLPGRPTFTDLRTAVSAHVSVIF